MLVKLVATVLLLATQALTANVSASYHYELGLNSTAYQQQFDELLQHGFRLTYVSAYSDEHNQTLFSGVWKKSSTSVPWIARHGLTGPQYDTLSTQLKGQNYHPVLLNAYNLPSGEPRFATIWEKGSVGTWEQQRDMTEAQLKAKVSALGQLRITTLTRYVIGNQVRFAATWGKRTATDWHGDWFYSIGKTSFDTRSASDGYKAISVNVYSVNGDPIFDVVWQRVSSGGWDAPVTAYQTSGVDQKMYATSYNGYVGTGFGPRVLTGYYLEGCGIQYAATFEQDS
jgi:hypothetical protein